MAAAPGKEAPGKWKSDQRAGLRQRPGRKAIETTVVKLQHIDRIIAAFSLLGKFAFIYW